MMCNNCKRGQHDSCIGIVKAASTTDSTFLGKPKAFMDVDCECASKGHKKQS